MDPMEKDPTERLAGHHVLVVEDEALVALDMADEMQRAGADVAMAASSRHALRLIGARHFDVAVLDFQLTDGDSLPVAAELNERKVPFFFVTAQGRLPVIREHHPSAPVFSKPMLPHLMRRELERALRPTTA